MISGKIIFLPILYIFSNLTGNLIKAIKITAVLIVKPFWNTNIFLSKVNKCIPYNTFTLFFYTLDRNAKYVHNNTCTQVLQQ